MSRRIRKTARAEADIRSIAFWIARGSTDAAVKWVSELEDWFAKLANSPGMGTDRSDLRTGMRTVPFGNYLIFFQRMRDGIRIMRVIHGARDYTQFFRK